MVRGLGAAEEPLVGSTEETEGKTIRMRLVWVQGQNATYKGRGWCTKNSPSAWDGFLPGPRMLLGILEVLEGRLELHHLLFIPVETTHKPLLTLAALRLP